MIVTFKAQSVQEADTDTGSQSSREKTVEKILALLRSNSRITQKEIISETGLSRRGVEWNLKELKKAGRIRRIGSDRSGNWEMLE
ncbi:MAG: winged helix-turn-helix domain-containing protein [Victivallales bacterium]